ncbi:MAG: response regulator [Alphaproteobacteria bacterium]|nr:response regulator [Alphaproteobacteria bacterium]
MHSNKLPAVLIVEDEPLIRMDAVDMVKDAGFKTHEASSADQAILLMDEHSDIGILFTDIEMPGTMNGVELATYVRDRWPPVRIILVSGAIGLNENEFPEGALFFSKPYLISQITESLNKMIHQCG